MIQSFIRLLRVNPGFDPHRVLTFQVDAPAHGQDPGIHMFYHSAVARLSALPGVGSASVVASIPLTGDNIGSAFDVEGESTTPGSRPVGDFNAVEPGYFRTMRIPIVAGRDFTELDNPKSHPVVIVNQALARRFFPNQNPLGRHVRPGIGNGYFPGEPPMREIVGVVADVRESGLSEEASPEIYAPLAQSPFDTTFIVARTLNEPRSLVGPARREIAALDKDAPIYHVETLDQYFDQSAAGARFVALLLCGFALSALLLACLGIYGVISYIVVQRTNEIGIRMALGANRDEVLRMVIGQGLRPALLGIAIGITAASRLTRILTGVLYGVKPGDLPTFILVAGLLVGVALLACYIPARRAANVDPMAALRHE